MQTHYDTIIIGAGLSGIAAAYYHQKNRPSKSLALLEGRPRLGGTWDLFKYPGVRSDSDMYTLGFSFNLWEAPAAVAKGENILEYLKETATKYKIDKKIQFNSKVISADWSDQTKRYALTIKNPLTSEKRQLSCSFLIMCSGYYNYKNGHQPVFKGQEDFKGIIVHPQHWDPSLDCTNKKIVIIGSGATAVTLLPALQKTATSVTMLQRSPTYMFSFPSKDKLATFVGKVFPKKVASAAAKWKNIVLASLFYQLSRRTPSLMRKYLKRRAQKVLKEDYSHEDFNPSYEPWDQRVCIIPDSDFFNALRNENANIVTETIDKFTANGILLNSGKTLDADIIITATGLRLQFFGGMGLKVNGEKVIANQLFIYEGTMLSSIPNLALIVGYTNLTWTLKCELSCKYLMRLFKHMDKNNFEVCTPTPKPGMKPKPLLNLNSGYIMRVKDKLPSQGDQRPWQLGENFLKDSITQKLRGIDYKSLDFK